MAWGSDPELFSLSHIFPKASPHYAAFGFKGGLCSNITIYDETSF